MQKPKPKPNQPSYMALVLNLIAIYQKTRTRATIFFSFCIEDSIQPSLDFSPLLLEYHKQAYKYLHSSSLTYLLQLLGDCNKLNLLITRSSNILYSVLHVNIYTQ